MSPLPGPPAPGNGRCEGLYRSGAGTAAGRDGAADSATDAPADAANVLSFTVNVTGCLAATGTSWSDGQTLGVDLQARSTYGDNAAQKFWLVLG
jgi:hypothetical protein